MNTNTHKVTVGKVVQYLILILMFLLLVGPFVWELSLSFKGKGDNVYAVPPYLMPKTPTLDNYISVFKQVPVFHYMLNTLVVCLISIFGNVVFSTMAGYALGRLKWRGRGLVFTMFMGTMVIPIEGVMISQFLIIRSIHLQNTLLAVALPGLCGAINILLMTNAFRSIPMELEEAAMGGRCQPMAAVLPHLCTAGQRHDDRCRHLRIRRCLERLPVAVDRDLR